MYSQVDCAISCAMFYCQFSMDMYFDFVCFSITCSQKIIPSLNLEKKIVQNGFAGYGSRMFL